MALGTLALAGPAQAQTPCANLVITGLTVVPPQPVAGQAATVRATVLNTGSCVAQGFVSQWRQTPNGPSGPALPTVDLGPGSSVTLPLRLTFPAAGNVESTIVIDSDNDVEETNEADNLQILPVTVVPATIDLSVAAFSISPTHPVRGRLSTATVVVANGGNTATGAFTVSWQPQPFAAPVVQQVNGLAAGATTTLTLVHTYPFAGTFTSTVTVDSGRTVRETDEGNNTATLQVVVDPPLADLTVAAATLSPVAPVPGQLTTLTVVVANAGNTAAGPYRVDWKPGGLFTPTLSQELPGLGAGATTVVTFGYTYQRAGTFTGLVTVDAGGTVLELDEDNNTAAVPVTVGANAVDLTVTGVTFGSRQQVPTQGEPLTVNITVANLGNTASGPFLVDWNPNATYVNSPSRSTVTRQVDDLGPGQTTVVSFTYSYPKAGNFSTLTTVDPRRAVAETNEANNQFVRPISVAPANIDLVVTGFTISPTQPVRGSAAKATITVRNSGTFPAGPFSVAWRLRSTDTGFSPSARLIGLNPGESQTVTLNGTYFQAGSFTTLAVVDSTNSVVEPGGGEANNVVSKAITVLIPSTTIKVTLGMFSYSDGDKGIKGAGEWDNIPFAVLDPSATCVLFDQTIKGLSCRNFSDDDVDGSETVDLGDDPSITVTLQGPVPLVVLTGALESDTIGPQFLGYASAVVAKAKFATYGSQNVDGKEGDCASAPACFRATFTVKVVSSVPGASNPSTVALTPAEQATVDQFKAVLRAHSAPAPSEA